MSFVIPACTGYQLGPRSLFPQDVKTVYVPMIESDSFRRGLGERLHEALVKRIEGQTPYKVVGTPDADSILVVRLTGDGKRVLVEDRFDEPREIETTLVVSANWMKRGGLPIAADNLIPIEPTLAALSGQSNLVPESGQSLATSHQKAIDKLATRVVALMEAPW